MSSWCRPWSLQAWLCHSTSRRCRGKRGWTPMKKSVILCWFLPAEALLSLLCERTRARIGQYSTALESCSCQHTVDLLLLLSDSCRNPQEGGSFIKIIFDRFWTFRALGLPNSWRYGICYTFWWIYSFMFSSMLFLLPIYVKNTPFLKKQCAIKA